MVDIPQLFKTSEITLNDNLIIISGFKGADYAHVKIIEHNLNRLSRIRGLLNILMDGKEKDTEYTKEQMIEIMDMRDEARELSNGIRELRSIIAQRGLKRYYYRDEKELKKQIKMII